MFGFKSKSESKNYLSLGVDDDTQSDEPYMEFEDTDTKLDQVETFVLVRHFLIDILLRLLHLKVAVDKQSELLAKLMLNMENRC